MTGLSRILVSSVAAILVGGGMSNAQSAISRLEAIPAQPLRAALDDFVERTGLQLVYVSEVATGRQSKGARAGLSAEEVLRELLRETGLTYEFLNERTVSIRPLSAVENDNKGAGAPSKEAAADAPASTPESTKRAAPLGGEPEPAGDKTSSTTLAIPDILVVGSRILNTDIRRTEDDAQPYMVFDRTDIERSGARNIEDFLARRLTASTSSSTIDKGVFDPSTGGFTNNLVSGNVSSIDLRGLGTDETLILIDGRRIAGYSVVGTPSQPDINGIPLAAIERIEVLPATASGIYGGGATGGVINIVLRRDYEGVDVKVTYGGTFDGGGEQGQIDLGAGFSLEDGRTSVLLAGSYSDSRTLTVGDRDFVERGYQHVLANNPAALLSALPPRGATTNISTIAIGGVRPNLTLDNGTPLSSPITFVPSGYAGPASDAGAALRANAGQYNLDLADTAATGGARQSLVNAPTIKSFSATARREFTSWLDAYLELATSENRAESERGVIGTFPIAGTAAGNPFRETILVTTPLIGIDSIVESVLESDRAAAGVIVSLPWNWRAQADYTWNRTRFSFVQPPFQINATAIAADISSGALNVFRDTNVNPVDFTRYLGNTQDSSVDTTLDNAALRFSGPLPIPLPGGSPTLSLMFEYRKEAIGDQVVGSVPPPPILPINVLVPDRSQIVNSAYLELRVPIVSDENSVPAINLLELQLAGRYDDYETNGSVDLVPLSATGAPLIPIQRETNRFSSTNPTFGLRYKPVKDVMVRGSYGTGFLPANVNQLTPSLLNQVFDPALLVRSGLRDPLRNEPLGATGQPITLTNGGNPDLNPEESESWSAGLVLTPRFIPGLRVSADWTRTEKTGNIATVDPLRQENINLELLIPGLVIRDTNPATFVNGVGPIIGLDQRLRNVAFTKVEALDFSIDYRWSTERLGDFQLHAAATHFAHNETQTVPLAPLFENAGTIIGLPWRGHAVLSWEYKNWGVSWTARHFDSYQLFPTGREISFFTSQQGSLTIPSQTYHDLFASYRFDSQLGLLSETEIQLGINNVFNKEPPVDVTNSVFYYSTLGDPRLASYYLSLRKSF